MQICMDYTVDAFSLLMLHHDSVALSPHLTTTFEEVSLAAIPSRPAAALPAASTSAAAGVADRMSCTTASKSRGVASAAARRESS